MAKLDVNGLDDCIDLLEVIRNGTQPAVLRGLKRGGICLHRKTVQIGQSMGVYRTGQTLNSLTVKEAKQTEDGFACDITFEGTNDRGNRNAEVAFINNYGKRSQPPRPFVSKAVDESTDEIEQIMLEEIGKIDNE